MGDVSPVPAAYCALSTIKKLTVCLDNVSTMSVCCEICWPNLFPESSTCEMNLAALWLEGEHSLPYVAPTSHLGLWLKKWTWSRRIATDHTTTWLDTISFLSHKPGYNIMSTARGGETRVLWEFFTYLGDSICHNLIFC